MGGSLVRVTTARNREVGVMGKVAACNSGDVLPLGEWLGERCETGVPVRPAKPCTIVT